MVLPQINPTTLQQMKTFRVTCATILTASLGNGFMNMAGPTYHHRLVDPLPVLDSVPNAVKMSTDSTASVVGTPEIRTRKKTRSGRQSLPALGRFINNNLNMPLITHMDSTRIHAIGGTVWLVGGTSLLWFSWARELWYNDLSTFGSFSGAIPPVCIGALATALASSHMQPRKRLVHYSNEMRNGMVYGATSILLLAANTVNPSTTLMTFDTTTRTALALAAVKVIEDMVVDRNPLDFAVVPQELGLELPPPWVLKVALSISLCWLVLFFTNLSHVLMGSMTDDPMLRTFAAQMALASSMSPAGDALVGTLIQKDRFNNRSGQHKFVIEDDDAGTYRSNPIVHAFQLIFNQPGPGLISMAVAVATGHGDVVRSFFYLNDML